eukprot:209791-Chlamydomonas_euryale.AAC.1
MEGVCGDGQGCGVQLEGKRGMCSVKKADFNSVSLGLKGRMRNVLGEEKRATVFILWEEGMPCSSGTSRSWRIRAVKELAHWGLRQGAGAKTHPERRQQARPGTGLAAHATSRVTEFDTCDCHGQQSQAKGMGNGQQSRATVAGEGHGQRATVAGKGMGNGQQSRQAKGMGNGQQSQAKGTGNGQQSRAKGNSHKQRAAAMARAQSQAMGSGNVQRA